MNRMTKLTTCALVALALAGCASVKGTDRVANGTIDEVAKLQKRPATEKETAAVLTALQQVAKDPSSVRVQDVYVDVGGAQYLGFCGNAIGKDSDGKLGQAAPVNGVFDTTEAKIQAHNLRVGKLAGELCKRMNYPLPTQP
jgi:hypothetical protein